MRKLRGFRLGRKLVTVFKWIVRPRRTSTRYRRLDSPAPTLNPISRICNFAKDLCFKGSDSGYVRLDRVQTKPVVAPKGHLAVYVGESDGDTRRILVPVIYFNHPLFGELLKEAERVYGFNQPSGITLPCAVSEFEKVKMRIAAGDHGRRRSRWRPYFW